MTIKHKEFKLLKLSLVVFNDSGIAVKGCPWRVQIMDRESSREIYDKFFKKKSKAIIHYEALIKKINSGDFEFKYEKIKTDIIFPS